MKTYRSRPWAAVTLAAALSSPWLGTACRNGPEVTAVVTPGPATARAQPPAPAPGATAAAVTTRTLLLWTVAQLEPPEGQGLSALASRWSERDPLTSLQFSQRPGRGARGVLAYLDILSRTAPAALPDVTALPLSDVRAAREAGLLRPLPEALIGSPQLAQSWPFARMAVSDESSQAWALPLAVSVPHLTWAAPPADPPQSWSALLAEARVAMPTTDDDTSLAAALTLYAGYGGDPGSLPTVDREAAGAWLGSLAARTQRLRAADAPLEALRAGEAEVAVSGTGAFVVAGDAGSWGWSALPGPSGPAPLVATGWALALVARPGSEPGGGAALIEALTAPTVATWTLAAGMLPAGSAAWAESLRALSEPPPAAYRDFVTLRLEGARAPAALGGSAPLWTAAARSALAGEDIEPALEALTAAR